jgi:putative ABC transport system permease protein
MSGIVAAIRLVGVWLRGAPLAITALVLVVAIASFLATAAPLWFDRTSESALATLVHDAPAGGSSLEFEETGKLASTIGDNGHALDAVAAEGQKLLGQVPPSIAGGLGPAVTLIDSVEFLALKAPQPTTYLTLRIEPSMADAIHFYDGRAPTGNVPFEENDIGFGPVPVFEVALSRATADALLLKVGDKLNTTHISARGISQSNSFMRALVVGLFDVDANDPRWFDDHTLDTPSIRRITAEKFDYHAIALLSPDAYDPLLFAPVPQVLRYRWRFAVDPGRPAAVGVETFSTDLGKLERAFPFRAGAAVPGVAGVSTGLTPILDRYQSERAVAATVVALASVGAIGATTGALALIVGAVRRRRQPTIRLARARGASVTRLVAIGLLEAIVVVVPASAIGWLAASAALGGRAGAGFSAGSPTAAALVAGVAALLLVSAALGSARMSLASGRRQSDRSIDARNRRRVLDGLVIVAAIALSLGLQSGPTTATAAAPVDVTRAAAPALLALAAAVVLLRLFDGLVALLARATRGGRGFVLVHAARSLARGPRTHELPLLVLLVAVASGVFATTVTTTITRTQSLAAERSVGAEFRIQSANPGPLPPNIDLQGLAAVGRTAIDARDQGSLKAAGPAPLPVDVVGIDAAAYRDVVADTALDPGLPAPFYDAAPSPLPILVPPGVASDAGLHTGDAVQLTMGAETVPVVVAGIADPISSIGLGRGIIAPLAALKAAFPDRTLLATQVFVRATPADQPRIEAIVAPYAPGVLLFTRTDALAGLRASPLVGAIETAFLAAELIAIAFAVVVVASSAAQSLALRSSELSLLRAIGLPDGRALAVVGLELLSTVVVAVVAGVGLGIATADLVVPGVGVGQLVGASQAAAPTAELSGLAIAALAPALAALVAIAVLGRSIASPTTVREWIRTAET